MSSFVFAESDKLGLPVDYFRVAFFDKVSMCWCYFRTEVRGCGRSDIGGGVRVVLVYFYSCKRIGLWRRCGRCVGVILRGGGKIAGLTDETRVVVSSGCQTAASYMNVAALKLKLNHKRDLSLECRINCCYDNPESVELRSGGTGRKK